MVGAHKEATEPRLPGNFQICWLLAYQMNVIPDIIVCTTTLKVAKSEIDAIKIIIKLRIIQ
jgi:hypothetical protein